MHMRFLSRGFKNLQWYGMTSKKDKKYVRLKNPDFIGVFLRLGADFQRCSSVDVKSCFSLCG